MENLFNWNQVTVFLESAGKSRDISLWHRESLQSAVYNSYFVIYCIFMFKFIGLLMIFCFRYFSVFSFCLDFYLSLVLLSVLSEVLLMSVWVFLECRLIHPSEPPLSIFFSFPISCFTLIVVFCFGSSMIVFTCDAHSLHISLWLHLCIFVPPTKSELMGKKDTSWEEKGLDWLV